MHGTALLSFVSCETDQFDATEAAHAECSDDFDVFQSNCTELVKVGVDRRRRQRTRSQTTVAHVTHSIIIEQSVSTRSPCKLLVHVALVQWSSGRVSDS